MTDQKITVVISERISPYPPVSPWPLIYTLEGVDAQDKDALAREVAAIRYMEIGEGAEEDRQGILEKIAAGIEVHFVFDGDIDTIADFRE